MRKLAIGADRDQLLIILETDGKRQWERFSVTTKERNDHQLVTDFLVAQAVTWETIDSFLLLTIPHSKTTVRVDATLLGTAGWYFGTPLVILSVESLERVDPETVAFVDPVSSNFDPQVLRQLS